MHDISLVVSSAMEEQNAAMGQISGNTIGASKRVDEINDGIVEIQNAILAANNASEILARSGDQLRDVAGNVTTCVGDFLQDVDDGHHQSTA